MTSSYAPFATSLNPNGQTPIVVTGQPVNASSFLPAQVYNHNNGNNYHPHANAYPPKNANNNNNNNPPRRGCRDCFWALLFYAHLAGIVASAVLTAPTAMADWMDAAANSTSSYNNYNNNNNNNNGGNGDDAANNNNNGGRFLSHWTHRFLEEAAANNNGGDDSVNNDTDSSLSDIAIDPTALMIVLAVCGIGGLIMSSLALSFMMIFAEGLIKIALIFNILLLAGSALLALATANVLMALLSVFMCAFSAYYTCQVWSRIPFAAVNLVTAVTAVRNNMGLALYAYWSLLGLFCWSLLWSISFTCTTYVLSDCDAEQGECNESVNGVVMFLFVLSYYWTAQVIANVVHVTTAGTVGTWWFQPTEARGCCSLAVRQSYLRALTTSFGSICLGSLMVALIQTVREFIESARHQGDSILMCVADCLMGCIESLVEYFNKWAFVYVGLYGFSFMEAGQNVMGLFRARGWTSIIADLMVDTVLNLVALGVGLVLGMIAVGVAMAAGFPGGLVLIIPLLLGCGIGYAMCATLFSIVSSATNTVIVCYAEAPNEFQTNHPELSQRMRDAWRQAWPNEFGY
jgi:hypothetical protein